MARRHINCAASAWYRGYRRRNDISIMLQEPQADAAVTTWRSRFRYQAADCAPVLLYDVQQGLLPLAFVVGVVPKPIFSLK